MIVKYCEQILLSGLSKAFVLPHHATKTMVVAACLLTAQQMNMLSVDYNDLFCGLVLMAILVRLITSWVFKVGKWLQPTLFLTKLYFRIGTLTMGLRVRSAI